MKSKLFTSSKIILGLIFFIFGLNGLIPFLPMTPPPMPEAAVAFTTGLAATKYFFPFLKLTEMICGLLLITGFASPLALIILAPITLNIFLFHIILTPGLQNAVMPVVILLLHVTASTQYWYLYKPLFSKK